MRENHGLVSPGEAEEHKGRELVTGSLHSGFAGRTLDGAYMATFGMDRWAGHFAILFARLCFVPLIVWTLGVVPSVAGAQSADLRYRVAVLDFDVNDLSGQVLTPQGLGRAMATEFQTPLVRSGRFTVITRLDLEKVLDELALGPTGILNPDQVQAFGEIAGVDIIITGNITVFSSSSYSISATFINVATGEVAHAATLRVSAPEEFLEAAGSFVEGALVRFPLQGAVLAIEGDAVYINIGILHGLTSSDQTGLIYRPREVAGRSIPLRIGNFTISNIYQDVALIVPEIAADHTLMVGDVVIVQPLEDPRAATNEPAGVTVDVELSPEFAQALVDGVVTSFPVELTADLHSALFTAPGYQEVALEIDTRSGETVNLVVALEPNPATLVFEAEAEGYAVFVDGRSYGEVAQLQLPAGTYQVDVTVAGRPIYAQPLTLGPEETVTVVLPFTTAAVAESAEPEATTTAAPTPPDPGPEAAATATAPAALLVSTNALPVTITFEGPVSEEFMLISEVTEVALPDGIYLVSAESPRHGKIETVAFVDSMSPSNLELVFEVDPVRAVLGPYRSADGTGTLLDIVNLTGTGPARVTVTGPAGWNGGRPVEVDISLDDDFHVLSRREYQPGTYKIRLSSTEFAALELDAVLQPMLVLPQAAQLKLALGAGDDQLVATWSAVDEADTYLVELLGEERQTLVTSGNSGTFTAAVRSSSRFTLCLTAIDLRDDQQPHASTRASSRCETFADLLPQTARSRPRGEDRGPTELPGSPTLPPIPPPPP